MARSYRGGAGEFARLWDQLPAARQQQMLGEARAALRLLRADKPLHPPYTGKHSHRHSDYEDPVGSHMHEHEHDNDADHDHVHTSAEASARTGRHVRFQRGQVVLLNSARQASADAAWAKAARDLGVQLATPF